MNGGLKRKEILECLKLREVEEAGRRGEATGEYRDWNGSNGTDCNVEVR